MNTFNILFLSSCLITQRISKSIGLWNNSVDKWFPSNSGYTTAFFFFFLFFSVFFPSCTPVYISYTSDVFLYNNINEYIYLRTHTSGKDFDSGILLESHMTPYLQVLNAIAKFNIIINIISKYIYVYTRLYICDYRRNLLVLW